MCIYFNPSHSIDLMLKSWTAHLDTSAICGTGTVAANISKAFSHVQLMVYDLPCIDIVASLPKSKRMNYVVGDMLVSIPFVDAILIKVCNLIPFL